MPTTPHIERHFTATEMVRDVVIGMSDGLTVPFALAAGLTGAVDSTSIIVTAGLAEIAAGSIAMGLGGYLAAKTDAEHYQAERIREIRETETVPAVEQEEIAEIFRGYGMSEDQVQPVVAAISADRDRWVDFMMRFELGLEAPEPRPRAHQRADDRGFVHRRRTHSAGAVLRGPLDRNRADLFGRVHALGAGDLRICQSAAYRHRTSARRADKPW